MQTTALTRLSNTCRWGTHTQTHTRFIKSYNPLPRLTQSWQLRKWQCRVANARYIISEELCIYQTSSTKPLNSAIKRLSWIYESRNAITVIIKCMVNEYRFMTLQTIYYCNLLFIIIIIIIINNYNNKSVTPIPI